MSFNDLNLIEPIAKALREQGYEKPTPIQVQAIPVVLEGKDLLGCAQTGTGKTAAFSLPILQRLYAMNGVRGVKALILTPTRELAVQIGETFAALSKYTRLRHTVIFGGVSQFHQANDIRRGVDIIVATPGRLLDLMNQGLVNLSRLEILVFDEADRMLDMGFIHDIKRILTRVPSQRQTLFFSATMPTEIQSLAFSILQNPVKVEVTPVSSTSENVNQAVYYVEKPNKKALLQHLIREQNMPHILVFTRTKHGADRVATDLNKAGITAEAIHGNKSQGARQRALNNFKSRTTRVLVATDIAARGIDVTDLPFVINYELPDTPETYVHRIGRTGRAGAKGAAFSFCGSDEREMLRDINKLAKKPIPVIAEHPFVSTGAPAPAAAPQSKGPRTAQSGTGAHGGGGQKRKPRRFFNAKAR